jgi:hypothetical protein
VTVTANAAVAPDGTTTADLVYPTTTGTSRRILRDIVVATTGGVTYTQSLYVKSAGFRWLRTTGVNAASAADNIWFDIIDGVVGTVGGGVTAYSISAVGDGWFRITASGIADDFADYFWIAGVDSNNSDTSTTNGTNGLYIWGAQLNLGSSALTYIPTTTAAVYSLPRDYNPTTGAALGVLVEEARTNLLTYSEQFDNAAWTLAFATVTANAITAPDGTTTADKLVEDATAASVHRASQNPTVTAVPNAFTIYAKAAERSWVQLRDASATVGVWFDLTNGVVGTANAGITGSIQSVGNGWYRCTAIRTPSAGAITFAVSIANADASNAYNGVAGNGIYIWGAQLEAGAFATSYIPTVASQVTRAADQISILTSAFPYSATAGTMVVEAMFEGRRTTGGFEVWAALDNGTSSNTSLMVGSNGLTDNAARSLALVSSSLVADLRPAGALALNILYKQAFAFAANDFAACRGGGTVVTDTSGAMPSGITTLRFRRESADDSNFSGWIKRFAYYASRKTDAELQVLST